MSLRARSDRRSRVRGEVLGKIGGGGTNEASLAADCRSRGAGATGQAGLSRAAQDRCGSGRAARDGTRETRAGDVPLPSSLWAARARQPRTPDAGDGARGLVEVFDLKRKRAPVASHRTEVLRFGQMRARNDHGLFRETDGSRFRGIGSATTVVCAQTIEAS